MSFAQIPPLELKKIVADVETLLERKAEVTADIADVYTVAKNKGYDVKIIRHVVRERAIDLAARQERDALIELYMGALGMLADTPLGKAATERAKGGARADATA